MKHPILIALTTLQALSIASAAEEHPLNDWLFRKVNYDDQSKPTPVTIPHTWNRDDSREKDYYRGPALYLKTLGPASAFAGKRVFVRFEAISTVAEVALDGHFLGEHRGGYTAFGYELTPHLKPDGPNRLEVFASNAWRPDVHPLGMDFSIAGGMHRPAYLVTTDRLCINPVIDGTRGVTVTYGKADKAAAAMTTRVTVNNGDAAPVACTVRCTILDAAGAKVVERITPLTAAPGDNPVSAEIAVANPHLWNGVKDPYLYTLEVAVIEGDTVRDTRRLQVGFRDIRFDAKTGMTLNGEPIKLHGVNRHQDHEQTGVAMTKEQHLEDIAIIRELGANAIRLAHYPHAREVLDECDRQGLLIWAEIPLTNSVGQPVQHPLNKANALSQLRELIRQQGSHASIFAWSLYNELGMGPTIDYVPTVDALQKAAKAEDPYRPTVGATFHGKKELAAITDLVAFNNYPGWYYKTPADMVQYVTDYPTKVAPDKPWGVSEYGAGACVNHHELTIATRPASGGKWHPEEWQCRVHEANYAAIAASPAIWGSFVWNMFDFATTGKNEGERNGINDKGLVTRDRKTRKDAFYFYQANWSEKPVLHLTSRRATKVDEPVVPIRLYTNLTDLRVQLNGEALPALESYAPAAFTTKPVKLRPGKNTIVATAKTAAGETLTDTIEWELVDQVPGKPAKKPESRPANH